MIARDKHLEAAARAAFADHEGPQEPPPPPPASGAVALAPADEDLPASAERALMFARSLEEQGHRGTAAALREIALADIAAARRTKTRSAA